MHLLLSECPAFSSNVTRHDVIGSDTPREISINPALNPLIVVLGRRLLHGIIRGVILHSIIGGVNRRKIPVEI